MHDNGKLWGIQAWSRFSILNMCYRALFTRSVIMAISAWINQLYSYNLLFARDVMTISNIPLDATKFLVCQILFHYDYSWFYEWYLVSNKFSDCWLVLNTYITRQSEMADLARATRWVGTLSDGNVHVKFHDDRLRNGGDITYWNFMETRFGDLWPWPLT